MSDYGKFIDAFKTGNIGNVNRLMKLKYLQKYKTGWRPINWACSRGHLKILEYLHQHKCNLETTDDTGWKPIHWACRNGDIKILKYLHQNKLNLEATDDDGWKPIHWACRNGDINILKYLHQNQCDLAASDNDGWQPIHWACLNGHLDILIYLHQNKCNLAATDKNGWQPIHWACLSGQLDILVYLHQNKCDLAAITNWGSSPIHLACHYGHLEIVKYLIRNDCDPTIKNKAGSSALSLVSSDIQIEIESIIKTSPRYQREKMAALMNLQCYAGCSHRFCQTSLVANNFDKGNDLICHGLSVRVYKIKPSQSDREFAIKEIDYVTRHAATESKLLEHDINKCKDKIQHENIVQYYGATLQESYLYIFMEYMDGVSLNTHIKTRGSLPLDTVAHYCLQTLQGLAFLHKNHIIHRGIKPANMLLDASRHNIKLCDFGYSRALSSMTSHHSLNVYNQKYASTFYGTPYYIAPEVILDKPYDYPADIWSMGASVIEMLSGNPPNHEMDPIEAIFHLAIHRAIEYSPDPPLPKDVRSFLDRMMKSELQDRATASQLLEDDFVKRDIKYGRLI